MIIFCFLNVWLILAFWGSFAQAIHFNVDVWKRVSFEQLRLFGCLMLLFFWLLGITVYFIGNLDVKVLFLIEFFCLITYEIVVDVIGIQLQKKKLEKIVLQVVEKYTCLRDLHDLTLACMEEGNRSYTKKEIEKALIRLKKKNIQIPDCYKITLTK